MKGWYMKREAYSRYPGSVLGYREWRSNWFGQFFKYLPRLAAVGPQNAATDPEFECQAREARCRDCGARVQAASRASVVSASSRGTR
jgi:hypothetical protein